VFQLPPSTRLAIDYAVANGRGGKGCVVFFAAGNGNESVDNDGYASYEKVVAVAACNDRGMRSVYSDFGAAVWCAFPSNDIEFPEVNHPAPLTPGIWTTDRNGVAGYNGGSAAEGDIAGNFTNSFGGTSSACPGASGVAALVLSISPGLKWHEVKDLLKKACDKIDPQGGNYDSLTGRSPKYGFGRLNALAAVTLAKPQPLSGITVKRVFDAPIPDLQTVPFSLSVADPAPVESVAVTVELQHTYIGDLVITLQPPPRAGLNALTLHNRTGGATKNLNKTYDATTTPALSRLAGKDCSGLWTLQIRDAAARDSGTLASFAISLTFTHPSRVLGDAEATPPKQPPKKAVRTRRS
jgi:subtilisin-like proprotein convertase family protein